jgi:hypothetical protein
VSATVPRRTRPPGDLAQTGVVALLLAVAAITWALTHRRMAGMDAGPGSDLGGLGWFAATWALMMAAMMRPQSRRWWPRTGVGQRAWGPPPPSRPAI